jgi:hypothetical protein
MMKIPIGSLLSHAIDHVRRGLSSSNHEPRLRPSRRERRRRSRQLASRLHGAHLMDVQDDFSDTAR